jgi:uncharacterized protein (TIGR00255 family)
MPRSMTGFGQAGREFAGLQFRVEVRSVNSRHFKATIRVPDVWTGLEAEIEQRLRAQLRRGSVYFVMRAKALSAEAACEINTAALERYLEQLEVVRPDQMDIPLSIDLASVLQLPGVCLPPEGDILNKEFQAGLMQLIDEAIGQVLKMQAEEGASIAKDLLGWCGSIKAKLVEVARRAPQVVTDYQQRLLRRVAELTASAKLEVDPDSLAREVAVFAERSDIAEELSRLASHLAQFGGVLSGEDQPGRKLDFIAQEMLREANTISAKANDAAITQGVVEIKTAIDRIKEQVQNLE